MSSDRFQIVGHPVAPGTCIICGVPFGQRPLVETGLSFDFCGREHVDSPNIDINMAGSVYFCNLCVNSLAEVFGGISPEKAANLEAELQAALLEVKNLEIKTLGYERIIDGYSLIDSVRGITPVLTGSDPGFIQHPQKLPIISGARIEEDSGPAGEHLPEDGEHGTSLGNSEIDESVSSTESDGVPAITGSESGSTENDPDSSKLDDVLKF